MSDISFKAQVKNIKSDFVKLIFEQKTASDSMHSVIYEKAPDFTKDTFTLLKNGRETAVYQSEFSDIDSLQSLNDLFSIFEILKLKEAKSMIQKLQKKPKKRISND